MSVILRLQNYCFFTTSTIPKNGEKTVKNVKKTQKEQQIRKIIKKYLYMCEKMTTFALE